MIKILAGAAALSALALVGFAGAAQAQGRCIWAGTYWDCAGRYVYPKYYPSDMQVIDGQYTHPPMPSPEDLSDVPTPRR